MSTALDRQIRPIYDALDIGSNKSAIVACNKILKKNPKNDLVKALKSLALIRSQKVEESLVLCEEVLASKPSDDGTLTAMMHVLRGLGRHKDMVTMFEEAYKQQPGNEDLAAQTFFANVRAGRWKFAQQLAAKMYKQFQEDRYLYWNVISTVLQASDPTTPPEMRTLLFKLAHRLITSSPTPSYQNADRFHLHLSILRELSLNDEAHTLLESDVGRAICSTSLYCNEIRREFWRKRGLWKEEGERAEKLIAEKNDRNWLEFLSVLDATFSYVTTESPTQDAQSECSAHIAKAQTLFEQVAERDSWKDRSGPLGLLELEKRARFHQLSTEPTRLVSLLRQYFGSFGDKTCCFEDLKPYLTLEGDDLASWTSFLKSVPVSFVTVSDLQRLINSHKLLRHNLLEADVTIEAETCSAGLFLSQYLKALHLGQSLPSTELQPADDLAVLAGNVFVNLWELSGGDERWLLNAVTLLEFSLARSPQAWLMRLMLVRLYRLLGAPSLAMEHYRAMRIKQIQHDTLSHFILSRASTFSLAATGDLTMATECIEATQIYLSNTQETGDYIVRAFTTEKYTQIPEFIVFEDRLDNSLQRDVIKIEHLRMRLEHEPIGPDIIDMELIELKFIFDRLHYDNRDFSVLANYQPACGRSLCHQTELFGKPEGDYLYLFLKVYIRAFQQASDLDDSVEDKLLIGDRPKLSVLDPERELPLRERLIRRKDKELESLSSAELQLVKYADALADWLEPYHNHVRPPPSVVLAEAAKVSELKTGHPLKGIELPLPQNGHANGSKKDEEAPPVCDPPSLVASFFGEMKTRFEAAKNLPLPTDAIHIASIVQEALLLFVVETFRFKTSSVVKIHKLGVLVASFKTLRTQALSVARDISAQLLKMSEAAGAAERRKTFLAGCHSLIGIDQDFILDIANKTTESQKRILEGMGKGMARVCTTYNAL